jgi:hypothetical protein
MNEWVNPFYPEAKQQVLPGMIFLFALARTLHQLRLGVTATAIRATSGLEKNGCCKMIHSKL